MAAAKKPAAKAPKKASARSLSARPAPTREQLERELAAIEKRLAGIEKRLALSTEPARATPPATPTDPRIVELAERYRGIWGVRDERRLATLIARHLLHVAEHDRRR